jgi:hypothetical protein
MLSCVPIRQPNWGQWPPVGPPLERSIAAALERRCAAGGPRKLRAAGSLLRVLARAVVGVSIRLPVLRAALTIGSIFTKEHLLGNLWRRARVKGG